MSRARRVPRSTRRSRGGTVPSCQTPLHWDSPRSASERAAGTTGARAPQGRNGHAGAVAGAPQGRNGHAREDPCRRCSPGSTACASAALPCTRCAPGSTRSTRLPGVDACAAPLRRDPVVGTSVGCVGSTSGRSGGPRGRPAATLAGRRGRDRAGPPPRITPGSWLSRICPLRANPCRPAPRRGGRRGVDMSATGIRRGDALLPVREVEAGRASGSPSCHQ